MKKKILIAPIITAVITMIFLSGLFFMTAVSKNGYNVQEKKSYYTQAEAKIKYLLDEIIYLEDNLKSMEKEQDSQQYEDFEAQIVNLENEIKVIEEEKNTLSKEITLLEKEAKREKITSLLVGGGVILFISFIVGLVVFLLIKFNVFTNVKFKKVLYLIAFWISFGIMIIAILERDETPAICFAVIAAGFLLAHNLSKIALTKEDKTDITKK